MDKGLKARIVKLLNESLIKEYTNYIQYITEADLLCGPYAESVAGRLKEIAADSAMHAQKVRQRLVSLGVTPATTIEKVEVSKNLDRFIEIALKEERSSFAIYQELFTIVPTKEEPLLHETLEDILIEEQEHMEELARLKE